MASTESDGKSSRGPLNADEEEEEEEYLCVTGAIIDKLLLKSLFIHIFTFNKPDDFNTFIILLFITREHLWFFSKRLFTISSR